MAFGNRLINTGGAAAVTWSLDNSYLSNTITATGGALNYNQYAYTTDNRIVGINNSSAFYMYAMSGSSATLYGGINTNYATALVNSTFEQSRFVLAPNDAPTTGYFYISCQDQNTAAWKISQVNLNTSLTWNVSSPYRLTISGNLPTNGNLRTSGFDFNSDGTKVYISTYSNFQVFSLSTPYQLNTATLDSTSTDADLVGKSFTFKPDGTRMFIRVAAGYGSLLQYDLSTPFDVSTKTLTFTKTGISQTNAPASFTKDGTKFYLAAYGTIYEWTCG
jgi:hypothetical protein